MCFSPVITAALAGACNAALSDHTGLQACIYKGRSSPSQATAQLLREMFDQASFDQWLTRANEAMDGKAMPQGALHDWPRIRPAAAAAAATAACLCLQPGRATQPYASQDTGSATPL